MSAPAAPIDRLRPALRAVEPLIDPLYGKPWDRPVHVGDSAPGALLHRRPPGRPGIGCSMPAAPRHLPAGAAPAAAPEPATIPSFLRAAARSSDGAAPVHPAR
jgi:hypothetical protein